MEKINDVSNIKSMARKSKVVKDQAAKMKKQLEEVEILLELAETEEKNQIESTEKAINQIAEKNNLFCGVVLTKQLVIDILTMMLDKGENVSIPFRLYFNE
jgi:hypothetical protein